MSKDKREFIERLKTFIDEAKTHSARNRDRLLYDNRKSDYHWYCGEVEMAVKIEEWIEENTDSTEGTESVSEDTDTALGNSEENIFALGLHEVAKIHHMFVIRVPGGWIYELEDTGAAVFVPLADVMTTKLPD